MGQESVKVSVIIPVYNCERYLRQCLDSVLRQTLREIEVICVDDGSTDGSLELLQSYARQDTRLTVLQQEHAFAGTARNLGKSRARGKYLVFWDADDFFRPDALEKLYRQCEKDSADVCICGARQYHEETGTSYASDAYMRRDDLPLSMPFNRESWPEHILNISNVAPWNKMFRRAFVEKQGLDFQGIRNGNDIYFVVNAICLAKRVTVVPKALVTYRVNASGGLTASTDKLPLSGIRAWCDAAENLRKLDAFPERSFANKALDSVIYILHNMNRWDSMCEALRFLREGGLETLAIRRQESGYYYVKWHGEVVQHLYEDSTEDFIAYFSNLNYRLQQDAVKRFAGSPSYKAGRVITWLPRRLREFRRRLAKAKRGDRK